MTPTMTTTIAAAGPLGSGGETATTRRALLIGVRHYPQIPADWGPSLAGCHNDVAALQTTLLARGFAAGDIQVLVDVSAETCNCPYCSGTRPCDGTPTRQGILEAVQRLIRSCHDDDVVVFHFSGHGSEILGRHLEAGRRFQTLVPHDSGRGTTQNRDIGEREVQRWVHRLHLKTPYVTLIFDCCHSGGLSHSRDGSASGDQNLRRVKADERSDDGAYVQDLLDHLTADDPTDGQPSTAVPPGADRWRGSSEQSCAIVLSASAAHERSSETVFEDRAFGLFTLRLCQALDERRDDDHTWADLMPRVAAAVSGENLAQHPRRQGNGPIFAPGPLEPLDIEPPDIVELKKLAVVIGIDYDTSHLPADERPSDGFPPLRTPAHDARQVARVLEEVQGYEIVGLSSRLPGPLLNDKANRRRIHKLINRLVDIRARTRRDCAVLIYFAGHGITHRQEDGAQAGFLIPWGARRHDVTTWLPMKDLRDQLVDGIRDAERLATMGLEEPLQRLTSRHLLLVLDCCFGGALSYNFFRGDGAPDRPIYYSEYRRFVEGRAWQLLSSSSANQRALDRDPQDPEQPHSPFAQALVDGLSSAVADRPAAGRGDQIITASELHQWIDGHLAQRGAIHQTPGLVALRPLEGQYIFHVPGARPRPLPDPPLDPSHNPWRRHPYDGPAGFYGRLQASLELLAGFLRRHGRAIAVHGPSGCGATSLVQAGLLPVLREPLNGRQRLLDDLRRQGIDHHYHLPWQELSELRAWLRRHGLDLEATPDEIAERLAQLARQEGWVTTGSASGSDVLGAGHLQTLGMPSFTDASGQQSPAWWSRLEMADLLAAPEDLAHRLRLWRQEGGLVDFFSLAEGPLLRWLAGWQVNDQWPEQLPPADQAEATSKRLLWLDGLDHLVQARPPTSLPYDLPTFLAHPGCALVVTVEAPGRPPAADPWQSDLGNLDQGPSCATTDHDPTATDTVAASAWHLLAVPPPSRDQLLEMVYAPAADQLLSFEPPSLAEQLVDELLPMPAPLPVLSARLSEMMQRAWQRRRDRDRLLVGADLEPTATVSWLAQRAEEAVTRLMRGQASMRTSLRRLFSRFLTFDGPRGQARAVRWEELRLDDPQELSRLTEEILPDLLERRILVASGEGLQLAHPELVVAWPRMRRWTGRRGRDLQLRLDLWRRAVTWRAAAFDANKLLPDLQRTEARDQDLWCHPTHNVLERALLIHSELKDRIDTVRRLADEARRLQASDWPRALRLAAETADLALRNRPRADRLAAGLGGGKRRQALRPWLRQALTDSFALAEQLLHDLLGASPLGLVLSSPTELRGRIRGLAFVDGQLRARLLTAADGDLTPDGVQAVAWQVPPLPLATAGLDALDGQATFLAAAEAPHDGQAEVVTGRLPLRGPVIEFPVMPPGPGRGSKAQAGHDHAIRWFPHADLRVPAELRQFVTPPETLLGHTACPTFLLFSGDQQWLVSAADGDDGPEIRLWPVAPQLPLTAQPQSFAHSTLESWLRRPAARGWPGHRSAFSPSQDGPSAGGRSADGGSVPGGAVAAASLENDGGEVPGNGATPEADKVRPPLLHRLANWLDGPKSPAGPTLLSSPDGEWQASLSPDGDAWLRHRDAEHASWRGRGITCMTFNPDRDGPLLVVGHQPSGLSWICWDSQLHPLDDSLGRASSLAIRPDGQQLAIGRLDGTVHLRSLLTWALGEQRQSPDHAPLTLRCRERGFAVRALAYDTTGRRLAVERRAVYAPHKQQVDVYHLDLATCILMARGHAPHPRRRDATLERHLDPWQEASTLAARPPTENALDRRRRRRRYVEALGLCAAPEPEDAAPEDGEPKDGEPEE